MLLYFAWYILLYLYAFLGLINVLGMTSRMAFAMGLQSDSHRFSTIERWRRARVWWALAWQDSHFSMSYDRPSAISLHQPSIPYDTTSKPGQRSYAESMFQIISLTLEIIRNRSLTPRALVSYAVIQNYKDQVNRIVADGESPFRFHFFPRFVAMYPCTRRSKSN